MAQTPRIQGPGYVSTIKDTVANNLYSYALGPYWLFCLPKCARKKPPLFVPFIDQRRMLQGESYCLWMWNGGSTVRAPFVCDSSLPTSLPPLSPPIPSSASGLFLVLSFSWSLSAPFTEQRARSGSWSDWIGISDWHTIQLQQQPWRANVVMPPLAVGVAVVATISLARRWP
jgi:hypothetical protein